MSGHIRQNHPLTKPPLCLPVKLGSCPALQAFCLLWGLETQIHHVSFLSVSLSLSLCLSLSLSLPLCLSVSLSLCLSLSMSLSLSLSLSLCLSVSLSLSISVSFALENNSDHPHTPYFCKNIPPKICQVDLRGVFVKIVDF